MSVCSQGDHHVITAVLIKLVHLGDTCGWSSNERPCYCPQAKFAKVVFLHVSVCHSVHRGVSASVHAGIHLPGADIPWEQTATPPVQTIPPPWTRHPPEQTPPVQCMLGDTGNKRTVRILLECILVVECVLYNVIVMIKHNFVISTN